MKDHEPLHILLTNDDGHHAPGIRALHRILKQAGHRVSKVTPGTEQSATGVSLTDCCEESQQAPKAWFLTRRPVLETCQHEHFYGKMGAASNQCQTN